MRKLNYTKYIKYSKSFFILKYNTFNLTNTQVTKAPFVSCGGL